VAAVVQALDAAAPEAFRVLIVDDDSLDVLRLVQAGDDDRHERVHDRGSGSAGHARA